MYVVTVCMYAYVFDSEDNAQFCSVTLNMTVQSFQVLVVRTGFIRQFYQRSCMIKRWMRFWVVNLKGSYINVLMNE